MPLDLLSLVDSVIEKENKQLSQKLVAARKKRIEAEREVAADLLFHDYVETSLATDPNLASASGVWDGLRQADILQDGLKILAEKENADPASQASEDRPSLLGLSPSQVLPSESAIKEFQHEVIPRVALRIESDRDKLVKLVNPLEERRRITSVTSVTPFSDAIEVKLSQLSLDKEDVAAKKEKREELSMKLLKKYDDVLTRSLLTLRESFPIVKKHQTLEMRQHLATLKTLNLKAKVTHLKVMKMIYTPDRLKALMAIRHDIDKRRADIDKECEKYSSALRCYDSAEPEFAKVVEEFRALLEEIDTHNFILGEYGQQT